MKKNEQSIKIYVDSPEVFCDGGPGELGHPGVYLNIGEQSQITCPYCSQIFALNDNPSNAHSGTSDY
jgi:uncharacterized Zn-finger protein